MTKHSLTRNEADEPVCECGFRPAVLDTGSPVGVSWKAKSDVLTHINVLTLRATQPFEARHERKYPRAGVRLAPSGKWMVTLWEAPDVLHGHEQPFHDTRAEAIDYSGLVIGAHHKTGTTLNGRAA